MINHLVNISVCMTSFYSSSTLVKKHDLSLYSVVFKIIHNPKTSVISISPRDHLIFLVYFYSTLVFTLVLLNLIGGLNLILN